MDKPGWWTGGGGGRYDKVGNQGVFNGGGLSGEMVGRKNLNLYYPRKNFEG